MNRRTTIKSILALGAVGVSGFSIFKWIDINKAPDLKLLASKKQLIAELAETIIPRTDTPGAKDAKVEDYVMGVLQFCTEAREQNFFLDGLADLEKYTTNNYNRSFIECSKSEKNVVMKHFEDKSTYSIAILNKINNKFIGRSFFSKLKELTIEGYCTSQIGATQGLVYDYVPGTFQACIPLKPNQRSWATK